MQRTCEMLREVAVTVHNSAFGRDKKDLIKDSEKWIRFGWERPKVQTMEEMKSFMLGFARAQGAKDEKKAKIEVI